MLLAQAVEQQSHWFGTPPPEEIMQAALDEALSGQHDNRQGQRRVPADPGGTSTASRT
jgi:hypothetical protein